MSRLIKCICGESFSIGEKISKHSLKCEKILERKNIKKYMQQIDKDREMKLFTSENPPCMCQAKYEETRLAFNIFSDRIFPTRDLPDKRVVYIDFPNFKTDTDYDKKKFWNFLINLWTDDTTFKIYLKGINKKWFLKSLEPVMLLQIFLDTIKVYIVNSDKAPVSRDDILMLKHLSIEKTDVILPIRGEGEKYRDLGYHVKGNHIDDCRSLERYGSLKKFKWSTFGLKIKEQGIEYVDRKNYSCNCEDTIVKSFLPLIYFVKYN
jgi:hypothetical protein